ncbi:MAG: restriction endonuclease subunit S [Verrucomicrobiota bacterium]
MTGSPSFVPSCLRVSNLMEQHFDTAFAAPDGIAKLRELILTLAMQGKLVEQDPNDPPASELLKEIEVEKQRLVKASKIKKPKPLPPIKPEEVPYELPLGWEWVRLGEIGIINPRNDAEDSATAGFVPMPLIPEGYSDKHQFEERPWSEIKKGYTHFADGDVGMAKITPCFENAKSCVFSGLPNGIGAGTTELHIFRNSFNSVAPRFLLYYLKNPNYISRAVPKMTGSAGQKRVPTPYFTEQLFPLPPLSEQHRIVARIDQLMARCDALEKLRKEREEKRLAVHAAAIKQLLDAPDGSAWNFIQQHFGEVYTVKENVAELRKAILQLAVMGRLVPQDPNDPPASELLKEIEAEKQRLVKEKKIKTPKPLPEVSDEEVTHEIPTSWAWVRFGDIAQHNSGKTLDKGRNTGEPRDYITTSNLYWGRFELDNVRQMLIRDHELEKCTARKNDLLICEGGEAGRAAVWHFDSEVCFQNHVHRARFHRDIDPYFAYRFFEKLNATGEINQHRKGVGISNMSSKALASIVFPLPPLPEQHRIVTRIDQLMALCDRLDQQIDAATGKQSELLNAVMAQV